MKYLASAFFLFLNFSVTAQTLFHYGNDSVSVKEFLHAYNKNNTGVKSEKAFRDYLGLYITSRLKIREARDMGYDTLPQIKADLDNLRQQILPTYLNDKESVNRLVEEALARSKKNIHLAHIFISFTQNRVVDSLSARKKLSLVQEELQKNTPFEQIAGKYSDDPSAKSNGGDLQWITVFTLPYALENLAYSTPVGKVSTVYQSKAGYHILKNLGERTDPGRIRIAQILIAYPPGSDEATKQQMKLLADSLYTRLQKGDDFGKLATAFSNDMVSAAANGQLQEFGTGHYDPVFEKAAYTLPSDGAISKPFQSEYGYHIIKRLGKSSSPWNKNDQKSMEALRNLVEQSDRMSSTKIALSENVLKTAGFKKALFSEPELWAFSDSIMNYVKGLKIPNITYATPLFHIGDKTVTAADWISFAQTFRFRSDGSGIKAYPQVWDEFVEAMAIDYYKSHLEEFNQDFRHQINEFRDGNLFFEIMQRKVWGPAQSDSIALVDFYNKNKDRYNWTTSADAVIFYASDVNSAKVFSTQLKKSPAKWRELVGNFSEKIAADSGRFEIQQIPNPSKMVIKAGTITSSLINKSDQTASFAYVLKLYNRGGTRSFSEARGLVINDYQAELEKLWLEELKRKYPVRMNEKVVEDIVKNRKW